MKMWTAGTALTLTVLMLTVLMFASAATGGHAAERPNILFIMSDDHGYQAIGAYGSQVNQTPNLDRLAHEGMRFDRCFVTNSICGPSRAVILTGKYSHLNGFVRNGNTFNGQQQTVAKLLQNAGYQTAIVGKWHLGSDPTGFDYWQVLIGQGPYYNPPMQTAEGVVRHTGYTTDIITDLALEWLQEKRDPNRPFFLVYQHKAPHRNWQPGPKYLTKYDDQQIPEPETLFDDYEGRGTAAKTQEMTVARHLNANDLKLSPQGGLTPEQLEAWDAAYAPKNREFEQANLEGDDLIRWKYQRYAKDYLRCVDSVDENVGRVLDYLDDSGLAKNTVVFYTSDQGWYLGEHGWFDKRWMYEESFRTPLMIRWPGVTKPGSVNNDLTLNLDFAETFLDIAGLPVPEDMQGKSLVPLLKGEKPEDWRDAIYYHYYEFPGPHAVRKHYGVRTDRYKLIYFYELDEWELYDLEKDPHEMRSVYSDPAYAEIVERMKAKLKELQQQYHDDGQVVNFGLQQARNVPLQLVYQLGVDSQGKAEVLATTGDKPLDSAASEGKLNPQFKPLVVGAWVRCEQPDGVLFAQGGESLGFSLYLDDGVPVFAVRDQGQQQLVKGKAIPLGKWTHVATTLNAEGRAVLFINGKRSGAGKVSLISSQPADGLSIGADTGSLVGSYDNPQPLSGALSDVRLYWGQLPAEELKAWAAKLSQRQLNLRTRRSTG